jgi:hypothetical protein
MNQSNEGPCRSQSFREDGRTNNLTSFGAKLAAYFPTLTGMQISTNNIATGMIRGSQVRF